MNTSTEFFEVNWETQTGIDVEVAKHEEYDRIFVVKLTHKPTGIQGEGEHLTMERARESALNSLNVRIGDYLRAKKLEKMDP